MDSTDELLENLDKDTLNTTILPDYGGITMKHSTYKGISIGIFILVISIAFILLVLAFIYSGSTFKAQINNKYSRYAKNKIETITGGFMPNSASNPGAVSNEIIKAYGHGYRQYTDGTGLSPDLCETVGGTWETNKCKCKHNMWGNHCERQSYPDTYLMANTTCKDLVVYETYKTDSLAFGNGVNCIDLCDKDNKCHAVHWDNNICTLLLEAPDIIDLSFSPDHDGNIFIKSGRPLSKHKVILYNGKLNSRFWLDKMIYNDDLKLVILEPNILYNLPFYPTNCINDGNYIIVYDSEDFTLEEARNPHKNMYVHIPGTNSPCPPIKAGICFAMIIPNEKNRELEDRSISDDRNYVEMTSKWSD